jgi:hypothetical protein
MPRSLVSASGVLIVLIALLAGAGGSAVAQAAQSGAADALFPTAVGLPELRVTATATGYEGVPESTEAGWYLMTLDNQSDGEVGLEFLAVPPGLTAQELIGFIAAPAPAATPDADATPGSTAAQSTESSAPPDFYYEVHMPGGPYAEFAGQTVQAVVELRPGDYVVWAGLPGLPQAPRPITVTAPTTATPAAIPAIQSDLTITMLGSAGDAYYFEYEGQLRPGPQVVQLVNPSDQPHFVVFIRAPGPITQDEALQLLSTPPGGTPPAGLPDPGTLIDAAGSGTQSAGTTQWIVTNLEAGYYIVACFITDPAADHVPHAFEGMIDVIQVDGEGTPAA